MRCLLLRIILLIRQLFAVRSVVERAYVEKECGEQARYRRIDGEQPSFALLAGNVEVCNQSAYHKSTDCTEDCCGKKEDAHRDAFKSDIDRGLDHGDGG